MQLLPRMNVMFDFIYMGSDELRGTQSKQKLQNEKNPATVGFEPVVFASGICTLIRAEGTFIRKK